MKLSTIIVSFLIIATVYAGAFIEYFHARSESDNVRLEWQTSEETNLQKFVIERKTPQSSFSEVASVSPKGNNSNYIYTDQNAYKTNDMIFVYRLKIVDNNNQITYSADVTVTHSISSVAKRTWGSIKAMFR
jgi:flagellar basal body L-ring protein FlgH